MGDGGPSGWDPPSSPQREKYREKIKKMQSDRVNGKGSAASSSAVPRRRRCSGGACSRSCSPPKDSEVEQAGSPQAPIFGRRQTSATPRGATCVLDRGKSTLIADEDHVGGGGGGECSYQAQEADSLERPQNSRAVSQGHGHDKKKKKSMVVNDRVNGKGSAASSSAVPTRGRCSGGACSRSCSTPKDSEVEQAGSPEAPITGRRQTSATPRGATCSFLKDFLLNPFFFPSFWVLFLRALPSHKTLIHSHDTTSRPRALDCTFPASSGVFRPYQTLTFPASSGIFRLRSSQKKNTSCSRCDSPL